MVGDSRRLGEDQVNCGVGYCTHSSVHQVGASGRAISRTQAQSASQSARERAQSERATMQCTPSKQDRCVAQAWLSVITGYWLLVMIGDWLSVVG